ncbi:RNA-binding protein 33 isoform X1 [Tribolium madens]|uniref:RNA-binding protein 33 isoform X1 n=1 Tax=Tribolium madens TaxID=41895 RepID=UPI001CF73C91|nr:RNA-binding protein 33 isoform X1 [Tribolium madens]XP_044258176.1 RNA-binding protein 33 isoform X1 [Tribolium madens]
MARLVNKQFNSPIGLYSEQNIREVIERESQILSNGAVGINFNNPGVGKPTNLQNSAVLRMLEEEEQRQRSGQSPSLKRVAWPPPNEGENYTEEAPVQAQGGPQYSSQSPNLQNNYTPAQQVHQPPPLKPLNISNGTANYQPHSPLSNPSPQSFRPATANKQWAPVHSPVGTPNQPASYQAQPQQYQAPPQQYQPPPQHYQSPPTQQYQPITQQYQPQQKKFSQQSAQPVGASNQPPVRQVEPPPATITLRPQAPVSQAPPPVVTSQPATATLKGGKHLRGDLKWPPESVKRQVEEENRQRLELAKGPACRPRLVRKDYSNFFAQHALNASYPGYKAPPGTQFYDHRCY